MANIFTCLPLTGNLWEIFQEKKAHADSLACSELLLKQSILKWVPITHTHKPLHFVKRVKGQVRYCARVFTTTRILPVLLALPCPVSEDIQEDTYAIPQLRCRRASVLAQESETLHTLTQCPALKFRSSSAKTTDTQAARQPSRKSSRETEPTRPNLHMPQHTK